MPPAAPRFLFYLSVDLIASRFAKSALPLPNSPATEARAWFVENPLAASLTGALQLASVLAAAAPSLSDGAAGALRTANFIAGGTAHVVALGVFVLLASRVALLGKGMRVFAWIAAVPAVASLVSLFVFEGAVLILLGRLLCMVRIVVAAVLVTVRSGRIAA